MGNLCFGKQLMMKRKAIIIDLDGTLLNSKKEISIYNVSKVNECIKNGHVVIIATARPFRTVINKFPENLKPSYIVLCNGALIAKSNGIIHRNEIKSQDVGIICHVLVRNGYKPMIEANDSFFSDGERETWFEGDVFPLDKYGKIDACKILAYKTDGIDKTVIDEIIPDDFTKVITDKGTLLQISKRGCTKLSACEVILKMENLDWEDTFAFGDDNNDLPVFEKVGCPIAMENATVELKMKSKWITESNDLDGVGRAIERYLLSQTITHSIESVMKVYPSK